MQLTIDDVKGRLEKARKKIEAAAPKGREPREVEIRLRVAEALVANNQPHEANRLINEVLVLANAMVEAGVPKTVLEQATLRLAKAKREVEDTLSHSRAEAMSEIIKIEMAGEAGRGELTQSLEKARDELTVAIERTREELTRAIDKSRLELTREGTRSLAPLSMGMLFAFGWGGPEIHHAIAKLLTSRQTVPTLPLSLGVVGMAL